MPRFKYGNEPTAKLRGPRPKGNSREHIVNLLFSIQAEERITTSELSKRSKLAVNTINSLRRPARFGKHPTIEQVRRLAHGLGYRFYIRIAKGEEEVISQ